MTARGILKEAGGWEAKFVEFVDKNYPKLDGNDLLLARDIIEQKDNKDLLEKYNRGEATEAEIMRFFKNRAKYAIAEHYALKAEKRAEWLQY